ncbi:Serine protease inhibitor 28 [Operophtera brumata]|uniref:Serine protease inhibitor 28 n=1 Tax=Operophtera brumata TaxID=104452 RepID=A0A0L7L044_OPEBR|nr:Serine protease inhibitor 28 [Operophtera brumata]
MYKRHCLDKITSDGSTVTMVKPLLLVALVANIFFLVPSQAVICCGKNEVYENCTNPKCRPETCCQVGFELNCTNPPKCTKGCVCKEDYVRCAKGICIPIKQCHQCNKPHEYFEPCDYGCPPQTCESLDRFYVCPIREGETCKPRCKCKEGYYRNINGECITEEQCRKCMCPHEYFSCGGACDNVCATLHKQNQTNCPIVNIKCNEMCYCEKDYARAKNGTCIPMHKCHGKLRYFFLHLTRDHCSNTTLLVSDIEQQCGKNERYEKCPAWLCKPQKCCELGHPIPCPCIPAGAKCPVKPGCVCVDGYVRDDKGNCIPEKDCPSPCCADEVYDSCINGGCGPRNCSEINGPILCIDPIKCIGGCTCKEGYLRLDVSGVCVPKEKCPKICDKPNEEYFECPPSCPERTCESIWNTKHCCPKTNTKNKDCTVKCKGDHEYFSCGPACDNVCCDLDTQSKHNCPIYTLRCVEMCYCEDGYARDDNRVCVCIDDCPGHRTKKRKN